MYTEASISNLVISITHWKNGDDSQQSYPAYPFMADPNWRRPIDRGIVEVILQKADRWTILSTLIGECNALCTLRTHSVDIKIK
jgi:hypothetical protein